MASTKIKMWYSHKRTREFLKFFGFIVESWPHTRHNFDMFGLFDQIAVKKGEVIFVQVKTNKYPTLKEKESIDKFSKTHRIKCLFISWFDYVKQPKLYWFDP